MASPSSPSLETRRAILDRIFQRLLAPLPDEDSDQSAEPEPDETAEDVAA